MLLETYTALTADELKNILPQFLIIEKEVTGNPDYSMFNLSLLEEWNSTNKYCPNLQHGIVLTYLNPVTKKIYLFCYISTFIFISSIMTLLKKVYFLYTL